MHYNVDALKRMLENHSIYLITGDILKRADLSGATLPQKTDNAEGANG